MAMIDWEVVGKKAFNAYCVVVHGVTHDGKAIPPWSQLTPQIRAGWVAAGRTSYSYVLNKSGEDDVRLAEKSDDEATSFVKGLIEKNPAVFKSD